MDHSPALRAILTGAALAAIWTGPVWAEQIPSQLEPNAGKWRTWAITSGSAIAVPAPPDAAATAAEIQDLKAQLGNGSTTFDRVAYWDRGWPGYRWQEIALSESEKDARPLLWRTMTLVSVAIHDATVAAWHAKYQYSRPRPSDVDATIQPIVPVPNSPSYPSEHAAVAAAAAEVLAYIFPSDATHLGFLAAFGDRRRSVAISAG
jgi:hypothetical protein